MIFCFSCKKMSFTGHEQCRKVEVFKFPGAGVYVTPEVMPVNAKRYQTTDTNRHYKELGERYRAS